MAGNQNFRHLPQFGNQLKGRLFQTIDDDGNLAQIGVDATPEGYVVTRLVAKVVPGGKVCGNCALMTKSPTLSAVRPSGVLPSTTASSTCPGLNSDGSAAAGRSAGF